MIFYSNRTFKVWAHTVSHQSLLLRSPLKFWDEDDYSEETSYNIDLEFLSVEYIDLSTKLNSMSLSIIEKENLPLNLKEKFSGFQGQIFEILSMNTKNYIIADSLLIGTNKWAQEDRIFNYNLNLNHDTIILNVSHK